MPHVYPLGVRRRAPLPQVSIAIRSMRLDRRRVFLVRNRTQAENDDNLPLATACKVRGRATHPKGWGTRGVSDMP